MMNFTGTTTGISNLICKKLLQRRIFNQRGCLQKRQSGNFEKKTIRRSLLYVPGHDFKKIEKLSHIKVDCAVLDCEDGVGFDLKDSARSTVREVYNRMRAVVNGELAVRINSLDSGLAKDDISAIFGGKSFPDTVVLPKINCAEEFHQVCGLLEAAVGSSEAAVGSSEAAVGSSEAAVGSSDKIIDVIVMVESARGLINIKEILESSRNRSSRCRVDSLIFGSDDFCADLGITRSDDASELLYARQKLVAVAKAFGIGAIDMVYIDYKDLEGLKRQAIQGFQMGFTGKQVIHPNQVPIVQAAFSPTPKQVAWARELLDAYENNKQGVITFRGQMIDRPTLLQAHNIISASCDT